MLFLYVTINRVFNERGNSREKLGDRLTKLIDVKSIMTLTLTIAFVAMVVQGVIDGDKFMAIYTMIVGFYFGVQSTKDK